MALRPPSAVGADIANAVKAIKPADGTPVTDAQLIAIWTAVYTVIYTELTANAKVPPGSFNVPGFGAVVGQGGPLT